MDVSAEFAPDYDRRLPSSRALVSAQELSDFKNSDALPMGRSSLTTDRRLKLLGHEDQGARNCLGLSLQWP